MKQFAELSPALSKSTIKVSIHSKSIPEKAGVTHVCSAFPAGPSSATGHRWLSRGNDRQINAGDRSSCGPSGRFAPMGDIAQLEMIEAAPTKAA